MKYYSALKTERNKQSINGVRKSFLQIPAHIAGKFIDTDSDFNAPYIMPFQGNALKRGSK